VLAGAVAATVREDVAMLTAQANVRHVGLLTQDQLLPLFASARAALLPYRRADYNRAVSPLKLFEYLAAGLSVVGIALPATAKYSEAGIYVDAPDADEFVAECRRILATDDPPADQLRRRQLAWSHDWEGKLREIAAVGLGTIGVSSRSADIVRR
jgi:teichuronic acid biosynthesis glycosyltransferase TuaH